MKSAQKALEERTPTQTIPTVSSVFKDGGILEMLYDPDASQTRFAFWHKEKWIFEESHKLNAVYKLMPFSADNNLIKNEVVLLPREPIEYESEDKLLSEIRNYLHRYVDLSPLYEQIASFYVLFSWIYDGFNELPYLRVRGDPGTGKTRFLLTVGSLCYKSIFASGASSASSLFRLVETFRGTLVMDESDFRFSDEKAELVKILNNGNIRGFPVLRSESNGKGEFNPRAYRVFGPKIVATRGDFEDRALESRFISEEMGSSKLREDIPINLPTEHKAEALALRNKLLFFRFRNFGKHQALADLVDIDLEPRLNQIFVPLLSIIRDQNAQEDLRVLARQYQKEIVSARGLDPAAQVLEAIQDLLALSETSLSVKAITARYTVLFGDETDQKITAKWIGSILRNQLHLKTYKTHGVYVIPDSERAKLDMLLNKYGLGTDDRKSERDEPVDNP